MNLTKKQLKLVEVMEDLQGYLRAIKYDLYNEDYWIRNSEFDQINGLCDVVDQLYFSALISRTEALHLEEMIQLSLPFALYFTPKERRAFFPKFKKEIYKIAGVIQ